MLPVLVAPTLRISKITGCDGAEMKFIQEQKKKDADLWVILPKPLVKDEKCSWKFVYAGDEVVLNAGNGNFYVGARESWYPKISNPGELFARPVRLSPAVSRRPKSTRWWRPASP